MIRYFGSLQYTLSRRMTKPTELHVRPAKIQISMGIHPFWSVFSVRMKITWTLSYRAHSEDSDQTGRMPRLIWVFAGRTCHFVCFVVRWLSCSIQWICKRAVPGILPHLHCLVNDYQYETDNHGSSWTKANGQFSSVRSMCCSTSWRNYLSFFECK